MLRVARWITVSEAVVLFFILSGAAVAVSWLASTYFTVSFWKATGTSIGLLFVACSMVVVRRIQLESKIAEAWNRPRDPR